MHPEPLFEIFGQGVYAYGLCMAVGIIACFVFLYFTMWYKKFNDDAIDKIIVIGLFGTGFGIFAAVLFQSVYNYIDNPAAGFKLSGMTFIGGLIGGVVSFLAVWNLYVYVVAPRSKVKLFKNNMNAGLTDALPFIPIGIAIAHAFGRFGCFWAGCCYGIEAEEGVWGLPVKAYSNVLVVPTQLYEMLFLIALAAVMALLYFRFKLNYNFAVYAIAYGIWRFGIEFVRDDNRGEIFPGASISPSQFWSILMVILGVGYIFLQLYLLSKLMKHPELQAKTEVTSELVPANGEAIIIEDGVEIVAGGSEQQTERLNGELPKKVSAADGAPVLSDCAKSGKKAPAAPASSQNDAEVNKEQSKDKGEL